MQINTQQIQTIHAMLPAAIKADKGLKMHLVSQFTGDPEKCSTKDLSFIQANELIYFLRTGNQPTDEAYAHFDIQNKQHRYILSLCHQMNWVCYDPKLRKTVADLKQLGGWLKKYGFRHMPLQAYTNQELPKLISQLEQVVQDHLRKTK